MPNHEHYIDAIEGGPSLESIRRREESEAQQVHNQAHSSLNLSPTTLAQLHILRRTGESFDTLVLRLIATAEAAHHYANAVKGK